MADEIIVECATSISLDMPMSIANILLRRNLVSKRAWLVFGFVAKDIISKCTASLHLPKSTLGHS